MAGRGGRRWGVGGVPPFPSGRSGDSCAGRMLHGWSSSGSIIFCMRRTRHHATYGQVLLHGTTYNLRSSGNYYIGRIDDWPLTQLARRKSVLGIDAGRLGRTSSGVGCSAGVCQACGHSGVPKFGSHGVFGRRSQDGEHSSHLCGPVVSGGSHLRCWQIRSTSVAVILIGACVVWPRGLVSSAEILLYLAFSSPPAPACLSALFPTFFPAYPLLYFVLPTCRPSHLLGLPLPNLPTY